MRFAILVSGAGSNLAAILAARDRGELAPAEVAVVVSNRPGAGALDCARDAGVDAVVVDHTEFDDRDAFEAAVLVELERRGVEAVVLAGFMRVLTSRFLDAFPRRIINTHPSLLPAYPGVRAPQQALDHGAKVSGCTVHFVDAGVDTGPIIAQRAVEVHDNDTAATLHARIQAAEHDLLPKITQLLAAGRLLCDGRRVRVS